MEAFGSGQGDITWEVFHLFLMYYMYATTNPVVGCDDLLLAHFLMLTRKIDNIMKAGDD